MKENISKNNKKFSLVDQQDFAFISKDFNPIHIDSLTARRLMYGQIVVHGMNICLWVLSEWAKAIKFSVEVLDLNLKFLKPVFLDEEVSLHIKKESTSQIIFHIFQQDVWVVRVALIYKKLKFPHKSIKFKRTRNNILTEPKLLEENDIKGKRGSLDLFLDVKKTNKIYGTNLLRKFGKLQIGEIISVTRLVGMYVPGLNSIFVECTLKKNSSSNPQSLDYKVRELDSRFHMATIDVESPSFTGAVKAFVRPKLVQQISYRELKTRVVEQEFKGQRALIIGGSRGIGEVSAKILAAGKANILLTYNKGASEAQRIVREINGSKGEAQYISCDILNLRSMTINKFKKFRPTHLYYFATPFIFSGNKGAFSNLKFLHFLDFYLVGFKEVLESCYSIGVKKFFYPSTIAIDEEPMGMEEYTLAKKTGELFCDIEERNKPDIKIYRPRLQRIKTDQTVSIHDVENKEAISVIRYLRNFHKI